MGECLQYATEKPADVIELRIYPGCDGKFVLYEDENDNYNYETGKYATIEFHWNDKARELTIGNQENAFEGMLKKRTFNIVLVKSGHGIGVGRCPNFDKTIKYAGKQMHVKL